MGRRTLAAMSGGVDSSVAAALLCAAGEEVVGATMQIWPRWLPEAEVEGGCCSLAAVEDARRVAAALGIPYYVLNMAEEFAEHVIAPFAAEYLRGRTPNPCLACNVKLKFGALLRKARELGAERLATGHYARTAYDAERGRHLLLRGLDPAKDQSYALYGLTQDQLAAAVFPLGGLRKDEVRRLARRFGLPVAEKGESQEICFVPDRDYVGFLRGYANARAGSPGTDGAALRPGPIVDREGRVLGEHKGLAAYTVGQRRGLGIAAPEPLYVLELRAETNELVVGPERALYRRSLHAEAVNWIAYGAPLPEEMEVAVKIRYGAAPAPAVVRPRGEDGAEVIFAAPQRAIAPGQAAVFYRDEVVVGGGTIRE